MRVKFLIGGVAAIALVAVAASALDQFVLHPQRQAIKILRYYASADAKRISELEQIVANARLGPIQFARQANAENCIKAAVAPVKAEYESIPAQFQACREALQSFAKSWLPSATDDQLFSIFVTALTSQLGQYGPSDERNVRQIAKDSVLNCTQTMIFVAETIKFFRPAVKTSEIDINNAALGEHGVVEIESDGRKFVLDGSTGTIFLASFNGMARPGPKQVTVMDFFEESDGRLADLLEEMTRSVQLGRLSKADVVSRKSL